eukprot:jgi/Mesvir1/24760/Mv22017-RA.1
MMTGRPDSPPPWFRLIFTHTFPRLELQYVPATVESVIYGLGMGLDGLQQLQLSDDLPVEVTQLRHLLMSGIKQLQNSLRSDTNAEYEMCPVAGTLRAVLPSVIMTTSQVAQIVEFKQYLESVMAVLRDLKCQLSLHGMKGLIKLVEEIQAMSDALSCECDRWQMRRQQLARQMNIDAFYRVRQEQENLLASRRGMDGSGLGNILFFATTAVAALAWTARPLPC